MLKFFQFSGTISGTTYFLRMLFTIVLSLPGAFIYSIYNINYLTDNKILDLADAETSNNIFESITFIMEYIEQNISNIHSSFTFNMLLILLLAYLPSIWFNLASAYKRVSALFYEVRKNVFAIYVGYDLIADATGLGILSVLKFLTIPFSIISTIIFAFLVFKNSDIDKDDHEG